MDQKSSAIEEPNKYSPILPQIRAIANKLGSIPEDTLATAIASIALPFLVHPPRLEVVRDLEAPVDKKGRPLGVVE